MSKDIAFGILIGLLFVSLILLFCVLLVKLYINKVKNYTKLIYQKDIDFQKSLTQTVIETQEQVLYNISQDLHDDIGQQLTYINFQLENLKLENSNIKSKVLPISDSLTNVSKSIRTISHSLNNQFLLKEDLLKAITNEVERLNKNGVITFNLSIEDVEKKQFLPEEKIVLYRIFQEIINNAFKHALPKKITIKIVTKPKCIFTISDDGIGFDIENSKNKASLGLLTMSSRAESIHYKFDIQSKIGKGTTIVFSEI